MAKGTFQCPKCSRTFSMAGHLGRHMSAIHGVSKPQAGPKGKTKTKKKGRRGRPKGARRGGPGRPGRPTGLSSRLGLRTMSLDQLSDLITEARAEARRKLADMKNVFA